MGFDCKGSELFWIEQIFWLKVYSLEAGITRRDYAENITRREKGDGNTGCTRVTGRERRGKQENSNDIRDNKQTKGEECHLEPRWTINKERAERLRSQRYTKVHGNSQKLAETIRKLQKLLYCTKSQRKLSETYNENPDSSTFALAIGKLGY